MPDAPPSPRRVLLPLGLAVCLSLFGDLTLYAVLPSQRETVGLSLAAVGVMLGANRLIRIPSNPLVGALFDRVGRRRLFLLGMTLGALSTLGYGLVSGFVPFLMTRLLWGVAWTLINIGGITMVHDVSTPANRGRLAGIYNAWMLAGFAAGPLLGGLLVDGIGFRPTMRLYAAATAAGLLVAALALPETHQRDAAAHRTAPRLSRLPALLREGAQALRQNPGLLSVLLLALIFQFVGEGIALSTLNLLMAERLGNSIDLGSVALGVASATGILSALRSMIAGAAGPAAGLISDRRNERSLVMAGSLVLGIGSFTLLAAARSLPLIVAAVALSAVSAGAGMAGLTASVGDYAPSRRRGMAIGAYATAGDIGAAAGPFLAYALALVIPLSWLYLICAVAFLVGLLVLQRLH